MCLEAAGAAAAAFSVHQRLNPFRQTLAVALVVALVVALFVALVLAALFFPSLFSAFSSRWSTCGTSLGCPGVARGTIL